MHPTSPAAIRFWLPTTGISALLLAAMAGSCGGSSSGGGQSGLEGALVEKPGGGSFFVDGNQSGAAADLRLVDVRWGRLVDVHDSLPPLSTGGPRIRNEVPIFRDYLIEPGILTNGSTYVLDRNPVTQRERLTIQVQDAPGFGTFDELLVAASDSLPVVASKNDNGTSSPPFTLVPRNACMTLRFNDCLKDDDESERNLTETIRVLTGYPPVTPFGARVAFDAHHGALVAGEFHTTRVLVDMTTSEVEASEMGVVLGVNAIGLPASLPTSTNSPNVSIRLPSQPDPGSGQRLVLVNLSGISLDSQGNGPVDTTTPTQDIVRAIRSGNHADPSNGFLTDLDRPRVVGSWPLDINSQAADKKGDEGFDFLVSITFNSAICAISPQVGDVIRVNRLGGAFLQVTAPGTLVNDTVQNLEVRSVFALISDEDPDTVDPEDLVGSALYQAPFHPSLSLDPGCWVNFLPEALEFPAHRVSTTAQVVAHFSEPMDPETLSPFGGFLLVEGQSAGPRSTTARWDNIIVGEVFVNSDLTTFSFEPNSPFIHEFGATDTMHHVEIGDPRDLAGNRLRNELPFVDFQIEPLEATQRNASIVLRFDSDDEYGPTELDVALPPANDGRDGHHDMRGQFFYNTTRGSIRPRPVATAGWPVDRNNPVPRLMFAIGSGVFTPLTPLGAKMQLLWRYCDVAWNVRDETKYNMDVVGLNWSPIGGLAVADFYDQFEIRLGHSRFLPDETFASSGLPGSPNFFDNNYLGGSSQKVVHNRALGYTVNPANLFNSTSGTPMMPYPLNRGLSPDVTYTWRDTSILTLGADGDNMQPGIPLGIEVTAGVVPAAGTVAKRRLVPSFGLPLLIELRCHPSDQGIGLNRFDSSIGNPNPLLITPGFRAYTAGGINTFGNPAIVLPDNEDFPKGGYNPITGTLTLPPADNVFYLGQLDTVVRVSRMHTVWLDSGLGAMPEWGVPVLEPSLAGQPSGTDIQLDFRSTPGFAGDPPIVVPFDADTMDPYGNEIINVAAMPPDTPDNPPTDLSDWSADITSANGRRYLQVRLTFVNNIATGVSPELTALALPYETP